MGTTSLMKVRVPSDLPEGVRWAFSEHLGMPEAWGLSAADLAALRGLRPLRQYSSGHIRVDASQLVTVRELVAHELSLMGCDCDTSEELCTRCRLVALAARIDYWLGKQDAHEAAAAEVELTWEHMYGARSVSV